MNMAETGNLAAGLRGELRRREPMASHVSWRAGGQAQSAYFPADLEDLVGFLRSLPASEPVHMTGLGSNLLVRDGGLRGTVIFTHRAKSGSTIWARAAGGSTPKPAWRARRWPDTQPSTNLLARNSSRASPGRWAGRSR
jgi:hypothetical protein